MTYNIDKWDAARVKRLSATLAPNHYKQGWYRDRDGYDLHFVDDQLHSVNDIPAIKGHGFELWFKRGYRHRETGPSVVWRGDKYWHLNGVVYRSVNEWLAMLDIPVAEKVLLKMQLG